MRPRPSLPRLVGLCRRAKSTQTQAQAQAQANKHTQPGGKQQAKHAKTATPHALDPDEPIPIERTALGDITELPEGIPKRPLHLDQLSPRRLRFFERTINKERLAPEDEAHLEQVMNKNKLPERPKVDFVSGDSGPTQDRLEFFGGLEEGGAIEAVEDIPGIEAGRVAESRRNGLAKLGLILGTVVMAGRKRLLYLLPSGEIWPLAENDIVFTMPASLIPAELAAKCWSPELLHLWKSGRDIGLNEQGAEEGVIGADEAAEMFAARRKVATILRKVSRETERMAARVGAGSVANGRGGGMEAVWEHFAPKDNEEARTGVTATEVAEFLLNGPDTPADKVVTVRPSTLPAFAVHTLMMRRPDLFLADERNTWKSGYMVRSRAERRRIEKVAAAVETNSDMLKRFVAKARSVRAALATDTEAPETWSDDDLDIIWLLTLTLVETRSLQEFVANPIAASIVKELDDDVNVSMARHGADVTAPLLQALGVLSPGDSVRTSLVHEYAERNMAINRVRPAASTADLSVPTPADAALDPIREDFSSHRVFVIDDAHAKELDDGVAVEPAGNGEYWIHVHVADPTRYLSRDDPLATTASFVGASTYFAEGTTPLLPHTMGGGDMSLGESTKSQAVMVFSARVDTQGNIHEHKVRLGHLGSAVLTTYADVNAALGMPSTRTSHPLGVLTDSAPAKVPRTHATLSPEDIESLALLRDLANALRAKRFASAGIEWTPAAAGYTTPIGGSRPAANIFDRTRYTSTPGRFSPVELAFRVEDRPATVSAENTVAELMVLANRVVAQWCAERGVAAPFRGSEALRETNGTPAHLRMDKLLALREKGAGYLSALTVMAANLAPSSTLVATSPLDHWLMGLTDQTQGYQGYVRATSPLRRFDDMLVHWQIKAALASEAQIGAADKALGADDVLLLANRTDAALNRLKILERSANKYWTAGLLHARSAGPVPANVRDSVVDLHDLPALVFGPTETIGRAHRVPLYVPSLGVQLDLNVAPDQMRESELVVGAGVRVRVDTENTYQWPNPIVNTVPASFDIVPPASESESN